MGTKIVIIFILRDIPCCPSVWTIVKIGVIVSGRKTTSVRTIVVPG